MNILNLVLKMQLMNDIIIFGDNDEIPNLKKCNLKKTKI